MINSVQAWCFCPVSFFRTIQQSAVVGYACCSIFTLFSPTLLFSVSVFPFLGNCFVIQGPIWGKNRWEFSWPRGSWGGQEIKSFEDHQRNGWVLREIINLLSLLFQAFEGISYLLFLFDWNWCYFKCNVKNVLAHQWSIGYLLYSWCYLFIFCIFFCTYALRCLWNSFSWCFLMGTGIGKYITHIKIYWLSISQEEENVHFSLWWVFLLPSISYVFLTGVGKFLPLYVCS